MGDLSKAVEMYQTAIQLEPNRIESYYELGVTYMRLKDYPKAITVLEDCLLRWKIIRRIVCTAVAV